MEEQSTNYKTAKAKFDAYCKRAHLEKDTIRYVQNLEAAVYSLYIYYDNREILIKMLPTVKEIEQELIDKGLLTFKIEHKRDRNKIGQWRLDKMGSLENSVIMFQKRLWGLMDMIYRPSMYLVLCDDYTW